MVYLWIPRARMCCFYVRNLRLAVTLICFFYMLHIAGENNIHSLTSAFTHDDLACDHLFWPKNMTVLSWILFFFVLISYFIGYVLMVAVMGIVINLASGYTEEAYQMFILTVIPYYVLELIIHVLKILRMSQVNCVTDKDKERFLGFTIFAIVWELLFTAMGLHFICIVNTYSLKYFHIGGEAFSHSTFQLSTMRLHPPSRHVAPHHQYSQQHLQQSQLHLQQSQPYLQLTPRHQPHQAPPPSPPLSAAPPAEDKDKDADEDKDADDKV